MPCKGRGRAANKISTQRVKGHTVLLLIGTLDLFHPIKKRECEIRKGKRNEQKKKEKTRDEKGEKE